MWRWQRSFTVRGASEFKNGEELCSISIARDVKAPAGTNDLGWLKINTPNPITGKVAQYDYFCALYRSPFDASASGSSAYGLNAWEIGNDEDSHCGYSIVAEEDAVCGDIVGTSPVPTGTFVKVLDVINIDVGNGVKQYYIFSERLDPDVKVDKLMSLILRRRACCCNRTIAPGDPCDYCGGNVTPAALNIAFPGVSLAVCIASDADTDRSLKLEAGSTFSGVFTVPQYNVVGGGPCLYILQILYSTVQYGVHSGLACAGSPLYVTETLQIGANIQPDGTLTVGVTLVFNEDDDQTAIELFSGSTAATTNCSAFGSGSNSQVIGDLFFNPEDNQAIAGYGGTVSAAAA